MRLYLENFASLTLPHHSKNEIILRKICKLDNATLVMCNYIILTFDIISVYVLRSKFQTMINMSMEKQPTVWLDMS